MKSFIHQQKEISFVKTTFTQYLKDKLDIIEVQGQFWARSEMMQDNLFWDWTSGICNLQIPGWDLWSRAFTAKWKRHILAMFWFYEGEGLFVLHEGSSSRWRFANAIRLVYVDQWDWEKVIPNGQRNIMLTSKKRLKDLQGDSFNRTSSSVMILNQFFQNKLPSFTYRRIGGTLPRFNSKSVKMPLPRIRKAAWSGLVELADANHTMGRDAPDYDDWQQESKEMATRAWMVISSSGMTF